MTATIRTTVRHAASFAASHVPFTAGALAGRFVTIDAPIMSGELPEPYVRDLRAAVAHPGTMVYVLTSYRTPIGWVRCDRVSGHAVGPGVVPNVTYSPTTARHQGIARRALDVAPDSEPAARVELSAPAPYGARAWHTYA